MSKSFIDHRRIYPRDSSFFVCLPQAWVLNLIKKHKLTKEDFCKRGVDILTAEKDELILRFERGE